MLSPGFHSQSRPSTTGIQEEEEEDDDDDDDDDDDETSSIGARISSTNTSNCLFVSTQCVRSRGTSGYCVWEDKSSPKTSNVFVLAFPPSLCVGVVTLVAEKTHLLLRFSSPIWPRRLVHVFQFVSLLLFVMMASKEREMKTRRETRHVFRHRHLLATRRKRRDSRSPSTPATPVEAMYNNNNNGTNYYWIEEEEEEEEETFYESTKIIKKKNVNKKKRRKR